MTTTSNCAECTAFIDGRCARSILLLRKSERVPECFTPDPESMAAKYYDGTKEGYEAIDAALATMSSNGFADEHPLFAALNTGIGPHITDTSDQNLHPLAGFLAGAANRLRNALAAISQTQSENTTQEQKND